MNWEGSKVSAKQGQASWERANVGAERLTREGRMWCRAVKGTGIEESVCAPVNTQVINGTEEVTRPCVTPDDVSG